MEAMDGLLGSCSNCPDFGMVQKDWFNKSIEMAYFCCNAQSLGCVYYVFVVCNCIKRKGFATFDVFYRVKKCTKDFAFLPALFYWDVEVIRELVFRCFDRFIWRLMC